MPAPLTVGIEITGDGISQHSHARHIAGLATRLEFAGVHYWVIGADRDEPTRGRPVNPALDSCVVASIAARRSTDLGLVVAASPHRDHPYNLARRLLSVDHAARGRVGWLALDVDRRTGLNASVDTWTGAALGPTHTAESIAAVRTLWRTWPYASVVGDRATGVFADTAQIRRADVGGTYRISGPLNVPGSLQGDLPVYQHAGSNTQNADLIVVEDGQAIPGVAVVRLRKADHAALDRVADAPGAVGVLLCVTPDTIASVLDDLLPSARRRGAVAEPAAGTLRQRFSLPAPAAPDLSTHQLAYNGALNPGARL